MIKIQINNIPKKKQEYIDEILTLVAFRVSVLQQSLSHINGVVVDFGTDDFVSFKSVTKKIIASVGDPADMSNKRNGYTDFINRYRANPNHIGDIAINNLLQFCEYLLANNNQELSNLLVSDANNLLNLNNQILNNYGLNTRRNIAIIKLAFDYEIDDKIGPAIKKYFRLNSFVKICPYCNIDPVIHQVNNANQIVRSFELDHFYDKSRYPLLAYSLFNLVPSDHTCNVTNKKAIEFTDEYHINPHLSGYCESIKFRPIGLTTSYEVSQVEVDILETQGSAIYKKIKGENQPNVESGELGNLNVFQIRSKYLTETHKAGKILKILHKYDKNIRHIKKHLKSLGGSFNKKASYMKWYEREFDVRFSPTDFNDKAFSKFSRDIHDYYFTENKTTLNRYIIELIND